MSKKNTKKKDNKTYQQKLAEKQARKKAAAKGSSQAGASRAASKAGKAAVANSTTNTNSGAELKQKPTNLKEKMQQDAAAKKAAVKQAAAKPVEQKQSWWQRAKNKAVNGWNAVKNKANSVKQTVSAKLDKTAVGRVTKKVAKGAAKVAKTTVKWATAPVRYTYKGVKAVAKGVYKAGEKAVEAAGKTKLGQWAKNNKVSKWVTKKVSKAAIKAFGKGTAKTVLKKIPGVSVVVGAGLAIKEAWNGNWGRAGAELASGAAGCFPPLGTAASFAIDGAIISYDVYESHQAKKASANNINEAEFESATPSNSQSGQGQSGQGQSGQQAPSSSQGATEQEQSSSQGAGRYEQRHSSQGAGHHEQRHSSQGARRHEQSEQQSQYGSQRYGDRTSGNNENYDAQGTTPSADNVNLSSFVKVENQGDAIVLTTAAGQSYNVTQAELEKTMSSTRAKGTMKKLQKVVDMSPQPAGLATAVSAYVPELKKEEKGTAKVNRNLIDSTVKAVGGSSKVTSITIDGKKIKSKDIQESYGCSKKEAKQILKAYGRAIEDGANLDGVLRDIAEGKKLANDNNRANPYFAMMQAKGSRSEY